MSCNKRRFLTRTAIVLFSASLSFATKPECTNHWYPQKENNREVTYINEIKILENAFKA